MNFPIQEPWRRATADVADALETSRDGLTESEAARRLEELGRNQIREQKERSIWSILVDQVKSVVIVLLAVAAIVSAIFSDWLEAAAIGGVIVINTLIGFFTEWRAVRSMEALQELGKVKAYVRRDGEDQIIDGEELVPGDVVVLEKGRLVPADLRLIDADGLKIEEAALTGESVPVTKHSEPVEDVPLAERASMAFKGTTIASGRGEGIVVATGMETEVGEISALVQEAGGGRTPLEKRLDSLGHRIVWLTLAVAAAVGVSGVVAGRDWVLMVKTAVALAIAAVPEGLAIVATVALAHGMWRMAKFDALIRRLSSVETLGSTNVIFTDKTGTITEGTMSVVRLVTAQGAFDVEGGDLLKDGEEVTVDEGSSLGRMIRSMMLANPPNVSEERAIGDPLDHAFAAFGADRGCTRERLAKDLTEEHVNPFDRDTKMMGAFHRLEDRLLLSVKGAPEAVLEASTQVRDENDTPDQTWLDRAERMAAEGLRVVAVASREASEVEEDPYHDLTFLGLVGILDPPREDVAESIRQCQQAGIQVVMVTGDHPETARYVARKVHLAGDDEFEVMTGTELGEDGAEVSERIRESGVFARVTPEQKLALVDARQDAGGVVAMTGDGVNDAPALKSADIGIAMGERGEEVAREAADMVLLDDSFPTIVRAIQQGRNIFQKIRKFVIYLLSGNAGEILAVGIATVLGAPMPLTPLQILYLNMINDVFPALAIGVGKGSDEVMERPPRDPEESIITGRNWGEIIGYGAVIAVTILGAFAFALEVLDYSTPRAVTVSFLTLSISRLLHVFNMRDPGSGVLRNRITQNPFVWGAIVVSVGLLLLAVYVRPLAGILEVTRLDWTGWAVVGVSSLLPVLAGQAYLLLVGRRRL